MPAIPNVVRRGAVYYWRRRVPAALAESRKSATLLLGLRTSDPRRARVRAAEITALADLCFFPSLMNHRLSPQQLQGLFRDVFTRHLDKLDGIAARERMERDFDAEDSRRRDRVMGWALRLLETRGNRASVDARSREAMLVDGMSEQDVGEVAATIAIMQHQKLATEPPARLKAMVEKIGGEPNPLNLALAQEQILRAMAEANFQTARRYDGVRVETSAVLADILSQRALESRAATIAPTSETRQVSLRDDIPSQRLEAAPKHDEARVSMDAPAIPEPEALADTQQSPAPTSGAVDGSAPGEVKRTATAKRIPLDAHPIIAFGEKLIAKNQHSQDWDTKTGRQARQIFRLFGKLLWEKKVIRLEELEQHHFANLVELLSEVATSYGKSPKDELRTTAELREIGAAQTPAKRGIKSGTLNRHLTFIGQLLVYLRGQGFKIDRDIDISLLRPKTRKIRGREKRAIFDSDELAAIFNLACFTGCMGWKGVEAFTPGPVVYHRALYFATLLLYYTGARREEICGLMVDDVQSPVLEIAGQKQRQPCLLIRVNEARRLKNVQSVRLIALLPEAVRLGFLDYVKVIRSLGYTLVFPDLKSPTSKSPMGDRLYDELKQGLDKVIPNASARKKVLHSFRKTFGDSLKQAGVAAEIRGDILGHGGETVTEEIYCDPIAVSAMLEHLAKLPIVTAHLQPVPIALIPWVRDKLPAPFSRRRKRGV